MIYPKPSIILLTGIHERKDISIEERAINFKFGIDEDGQFKCNFINYNYNFFLKTNVHVEDIRIKLKKYEKVRISNYPGFYICNYLYYYTLFHYKKLCRVLFVHLPNSGDQITCTEILKTILTTVNIYNE